MPGNFRGCGRGVFGLTSWDPLPRPGDNTEASQSQPAAKPVRKTSEQNGSSQPQKPQQTQTEPSGDLPRKGKLIIAKYSYEGKQDGPIGKELSFKRLDKLRFMSVSDANEHWWVAQTEDGEVGHVPASYMHVTEELKGLPWLENREPEEVTKREPEIDKKICRFGAPEGSNNTKLPYKPYNPTYDLRGERKGTDRFHCEICNRFFNGDAPYRSHMASKAHKEEMELAKEYGRA